MVYIKRIAIFGVKKAKGQENRSGLRFVSTFCNSLTYLCQILAKQIKVRKENRTVIKSIFFLSVLASGC